ncbi:putative transcriptional regulator [Microlunatus phosphovorus NM-1]|uniref:Putative transcriptional regulator n=1 Tax=Microlunatus phosphovorus (strain ATCC 700054 / DSM 10555 / JCM 9379 / NBRC 101784 / NCIMB 13414 / VKM Ac-1990 / NM-1) TaxID=1032480 RepID=F5XJK7_MICPN|nr:uroporphyrinogen-III synthase [Microlunatus phosphovorus]BAK35907.1 putative transcriptional regulator [Microlunatus phosphovorus NM-1]
MTFPPLTGFRIGVTSDRRSDDLIAALERRGATVMHAPSLKIAPNDEDTALAEETQAVIESRPEVVLVTTGYGMRRWFEVADAAGLGAELTDALESAKILARGPKSVGEVRAAGLEELAVSANDTTAALIDAVEQHSLTGLRTVIQLHAYTDRAQLARLRGLSARLWTVTPYRWVQPAGSDRLQKLIDAACDRQLDAITFTSAPGAEATLAAAKSMGRLGELIAALNDDVLAATVGPVSAGPLRHAGAQVLTPDRYRLGALIRLVTEELGERRVIRWRTDDVELELRGKVVVVAGKAVVLSRNSLALFKLLAHDGALVSRQELLRSLPDGADDHALEVAMSRLRQALGVPGLIATIVKRGYRLNAVRL